MSIIRLDITDFRNLRDVNLEPLPQGFNLLYGDNGSGKTSILETIYYLSLGRSFRSSLVNRLICNEANKFNLFAQIATLFNTAIPVGIERIENGDTKIRISGQDVDSIAELANLMPVKLINSDAYDLLEAPVFRRKYLDWGAFYFSPEFLRIWRQYERALRQRNAALRKQVSNKELDSWTQELITHGIALDEIRHTYVQNLIPLLKRIVNDLLVIDDLEMTYQRGWNKQETFGEILNNTLEKDRLLGYTQNGPHRADFKVLIQGVAAKDILSRGQQKLFVCAMIVAQGTLLFQHINRKPIYLVDDLPSELDITSRTNLMSLLSQQEAQIFVTAVERRVLEGFLQHHPTRMFHVEHGKVDGSKSLDLDLAQQISL